MMVPFNGTGSVVCHNGSAVVYTDEWSQLEMETFSRCLIETNKDFSLVAKQVTLCS